MTTRKGRAGGRADGKTVALLDSVDWDALAPDFGRKVLQLGAWFIATSNFVDRGQVFVSNRSQVVAFHPGDWTTLGFDRAAMVALIEEATGHWQNLGPAGMRHLLDCEPYLAAVRAEEAANQSARGDALDDLYQRAQRLLVAASGLTTSEDKRQLAMFTRELEQLQSAITTAEQRVARVRSLVTLAEEAVCSAV